MTKYRLWRQSDNKTFPVEEARDDEHALALFGELLGVTLTLVEGDVMAPYMMGRIKKEVHWAPPLDIPVYEKR